MSSQNIIANLKTALVEYNGTLASNRISLDHMITEQYTVQKQITELEQLQAEIQQRLAERRERLSFLDGSITCTKQEIGELVSSYNDLFHPIPAFDPILVLAYHDVSIRLVSFESDEENIMLMPESPLHVNAYKLVDHSRELENCTNAEQLRDIAMRLQIPLYLSKYGTSDERGVLNWTVCPDSACKFCLNDNWTAVTFHPNSIACDLIEL